MSRGPADLLAASAWKHHQAGELEQAIQLYRQAVAAKPDFVEVHNNLGNVLRLVGRPEEALESFRRAAKLRPNVSSLYTNLGLVLADMHRFEEAAANHRRALKLQPDLALAHNNLGIAQVELGKLDEAEVCFRRAIELNPGFAEAYCNLGNALGKLDRFDEAAHCYRRAIEIQPEFVAAHCNLANALGRLDRLDEAVLSARRAFELDPHFPEAIVKCAYLQRIVCDWRGPDIAQEAFAEAARTDVRVHLAFPFLAIADDPALQLAMARHDTRVLVPPALPALWQGQFYSHEKIRIAYVSADFCEHATAYLMAELFERHDRSRFETFAISYGPDESSPIRQRLVQAFDHFIDAAGLSDRQAALRIREAEIDIAIDLKGHIIDGRPGILAHRPAPIQVNYLGFPSTMGADFIDYIIVDRFVVPADQHQYYTEKLVHIPGCYQVNDPHRERPRQVISHADWGLPEDAFVFCCFNNNFKITAEIFEIWMRLMKAVPRARFLLLKDNEWSPQNLRREAQARGVDPDRMLFAPRTSLSAHLARHGLADLFLDTLPYNAHTTASDALWMGLPVVTRAGRSFVSRVAGSLLHAIGLPELVTNSLEEYEALALRLATQPDLLRETRAKLMRNRTTTPLFDADRTRRYIEAAYEEMWSRWLRRETPVPIAIEP